MKYGTYDSFVLIRFTRAIEWVIRIDRVSIDSNIKTITAQLDLTLRRVVTRLA